MATTDEINSASPAEAGSDPDLRCALVVAASGRTHEFGTRSMVWAEGGAVAGAVEGTRRPMPVADPGRLGLASRFVGDIEKGTDSRAKLGVFRREYLQPLAIPENPGPYKISIHSGSDTFGVDGAIGEVDRGGVHVETAGTSYLEAFRTLATCESGVFREIFDFSRSLHEHERRTYHVSGKLERVPAGTELADRDLPGLLEDEDAPQIVLVTFGRVLTEKDSSGDHLFKGRLMAALEEHEAAHCNNLVAHSRRHAAPFTCAGGE